MVLNRKGWSEFRLVSYGKAVESFYRIYCSSSHCKPCVCASVLHSPSNPLPASVFALGRTFPKMYLPTDVLFQSTNGRSSHLSQYSPASNPSSVTTGTYHSFERVIRLVLVVVSSFTI